MSFELTTDLARTVHVIGSRSSPGPLVLSVTAIERDITISSRLSKQEALDLATALEYYATYGEN